MADPRPLSIGSSIIAWRTFACRDLSASSCAHVLCRVYLYPSRFPLILCSSRYDCYPSQSRTRYAYVALPTLTNRQDAYRVDFPCSAFLKPDVRRPILRKAFLDVFTSAMSAVLASEPGECCVKLALQHEGTPRGSTISLGGLQSYVSGSKSNNDKIVLFFPDIFGPFFVNNQLLMDYFASNGACRAPGC